MLKCLNAERSFSLVELVVVMGIIVLISALVFANYRSGERQLALERSAHKLIQDIRRAQEMAMSAKKCPDLEPDIPCEGSVPPRYGVAFNDSNPYSYILFADDGVADDGDNGKLEPGESIIETIDLEKGISINQLSVNYPPDPTTDLWITFKPPDPVVGIRKPAMGDWPVGRIILTEGTKTKTVTVNSAGLIGGVETGVAVCLTCQYWVGGLGCVDATTTWGTGLYRCAGSSRRCYWDGPSDPVPCKTCSNTATTYFYSDGCSGCAGQGGNACWRKGADAQSCETVCSNAGAGSCVAANWNDTTGCAVTDYFWNATFGCQGACNYSYCPAILGNVGYKTKLYYRDGLTDQDCAAFKDGIYTDSRACVCQY